MDIDKLNQEFNELIKKWDEKAITEWLEKKHLEEQEEKLNKRSEQLFCNKCNTPFKYDWHVEYYNCPKCGNDVAK